MCCMLFKFGGSEFMTPLELWDMIYLLKEQQCTII